jgi:tetratricopeptide (TPR) repeat protein
MLKYDKQIRFLCIVDFLIVICLLTTSCKKYLDLKPVKTDVVPSTLSDLQAVLDRYDNVNLKAPILLESLADNYYISTSTYNSQQLSVRLNYIWDKDADFGQNWVTPYTGPIFTANVVLDQLPAINFSESERSLYNNIKGAALFYRAFAFYELAQHYCKPYSIDERGELGIVLRLTSDINIPSVRSTVGQTYDQVINDVKAAINLLPATTLYPTRPTKVAGFGTLARVYLSMRDYANARRYADSALTAYNQLIDYNTLIPVNNPITPVFNKEVIFHNRAAYNTLLSDVTSSIDTLLYGSYDNNDLRKSVFFISKSNGGFGFRGSYEGAAGLAWGNFDGIVTDEMYLIRSECAARAGNKDTAIADLNTLLSTRWKKGTFIPFTAATSEQALSIILTERRKELVFRGLRWTDIRRLNMEGANITLKRIVNGITYTLPPNDLRCVLLIPVSVIAMTSLQQNPR